MNPDDKHRDYRSGCCGIVGLHNHPYFMDVISCEDDAEGAD